MRNAMSGKECRMHCSKRICVLGHGITVDVYDTGAGINILIEGGEKGHIGAVAAAEAGRLIESITFPSHKEEIICEQWARRVSQVYDGPVIVEAGVHYDNITKAQIREVLETLDRELNGLIKQIEINKRGNRQPQENRKEDIRTKRNV